MTIAWEWDPAKAASNLAKHGVTFAFAVLVMDDPFALSRTDPHPDGDRWRTIGRPKPGMPALLLVVHTDTLLRPDGNEVGRIISARRATAAERRAYEEGM